MSDYKRSFDFYEFAGLWHPIRGIDPKAFRTAAESYEAAEHFGDGQFEALYEQVIDWVRSDEGKAKYPAVWYHIQGQEYIDSPQRSRGLDEREDFHPPLAISLVGIADLHPWLAWHPSQNPSFRGDVIPALAIRLYGIRAHAVHHKHAAIWDKLLRRYGVDPQGDFSGNAVKAERAVRIICGERHLIGKDDPPVD